MTAYYYKSSCSHTKWVQVGDHGIYVLSYRDFYPSEHKEEMEKLDVFIGLTGSFDNHEGTVKAYKRPFLNSLMELFRDEQRIDSLMTLPMQDGKTSQAHYALCVSLLDEGKNIGFGCYGAHGRTGWLLAKLIKHYEGADGDTAIKEVRKRLCKECVETETQIEELGAVKEQPSNKPTWTEKKDKTWGIGNLFSRRHTADPWDQWYE